MRFIVFGFILFFTLTCSQEKPKSVSKTEKTPISVIKSKKKSVDKKEKNKSATKDIESSDKSPYWSGLQNKLQIDDIMLKKCKAIQKKYIAIKKNLPNKEKKTIDKWRQSKNKEYRDLLGSKLFKKKAAYDRRLFSK